MDTKKIKKFITWGITIFVILVLYFSIKGTYNSMVKMDESIKSAWGNVQTVYQRRVDLIPNLVNTVKGYADFEKSTLTAVIEARAKATQVTIDPSNLTKDQLNQFNNAQGEISSTLSKLMVVVEKYPELKANQNFMDLQAQLEGTENRISVERRKFNETVQIYNTYIRNFPKNIFAKIFGFEQKAYFEADQGAKNAPKVNF